MLTFQEKLDIIETFDELTKKEVSLNRVNFHFEDSLYDKTVVVYHLHPNGNGFVYTGELPQYESNAKGLVNIRDYSEEEIRTIITASITYLSQEEEIEPAAQQTWKDSEGHTLLLVEEDDRWNIYADENLEDSFGGYDEAALYLREEGFKIR
ncbi:hypothetical protein [Rossellomorea aquimaris]|uniref:Uncharacterized protein n=1 Tax=Rossellomorea aquimaris TaxID=189382 RepID=A0A1J6VRB9_9BACI|nr:hypothetical protein [Rossellomorea aquimaris]OIU66980.1 hypothetical protein BHE18_13845 [Rossellomorea aquimaris]